MAQVVRPRVRKLELVVAAKQDSNPHEVGLELNDAALAALKAPKTLHKVALGGSLFLWCYPNGSKLWRLRYRLEHAQREYAIGPYGTGPGEYTLEAARAEAARARDVLARGLDPVRERKAQRVNEEAEAAQRRAAQAAKLISFETLANEWFASKARKWSPSHVKATRTRLDTVILPVLGAKPLALVDSPFVLSFLQSLERSGRHEVLAKSRGIVSAIMRFAIATGRASVDPTVALRGTFEKPPVVSRRTIKLSQFPKLFEALAAVPAEGVTKLALYWVIATACRTIEMRGALWSEIGTTTVDGARVGLWRVDPVRMKMRKPWTQPLSPLAIRILERAKAHRTSDDDEAFIFPGFSRDGRLSENALLALLARAGFFGRQTAHGFRSAFSTWAHERYTDSIAVELAYGHRVGGVAGLYARGEHVPSRLAILTAWGEELEALGLVLP